jgi:hypothetical protein
MFSIELKISSLFRHQPSLINTVQSDDSSAMERQHYLTRKIIGSDGSILVTYQTILHSNRLNVFKTHLLT